MKRLILFDIDGTLLLGECKSHLKSFDYAFREVFGNDASIHEIQFSGKTDTRIITEVLEKHGIGKYEIKGKIHKVYQTMAEYVRDNINSEPVQNVNPGADELLRKLKKNGHISGIVSGNLGEVAKLKLRRARILKFFDVGGFGEVSENRSELVEYAVKEAEEKFGYNFSNSDIFVVGDTPHDITAGKESRVKTIAVATGRYGFEELGRYNPDFIFPDLENYEEVLKAIES